MFGTMAGGVNPGRGLPEKNWAQCLADGIRVFKATEGSTDSSPLLFGVETVLWPSAAKKSGNWQRGIVDAVDRFMTRCHRGEAEKSWLRLTAEDAKSSNQGKPGVCGGGSSRTDTAVRECRNEMVDRVARCQFDYYVQRVLL